MLDIHAAQALIENGDPAIFSIVSQTSHWDRQMLLALQTIVRREKAGYAYAETGSYMGGTLVPHLVDLRCTQVISIDKRPDLQPDERSVTFDYAHASTERMLQGLEAELPMPAMLKLRTYDSDAAELPADAMGVALDLAFIDGEHTNRAAFSDFMSLWRFMADDCIIAFHDANLVIDAIFNIDAFLKSEGVQFRGLVLPDVVFAFFVGSHVRSAAPLVRRSLDREAFYRTSKEALWAEIAHSRRGVS